MLKYYDKSKPTIYLDWSHYNYAFNGSIIGAEDIDICFHSLIFQISKNANLCFSINHFLELMKLDDKKVRYIFSAWLDCLNLVFIKNELTVKKLERNKFINLKERDKPNENDSLKVFTNSMFDAFFSVIDFYNFDYIKNIISINDCLVQFLKNPYMFNKFDEQKSVMLKNTYNLYEDYNFIKIKNIF